MCISQILHIFLQILDIVATILVVVGVLFAAITLHLQKKGQDAQSINDVIREIGNVEIQQARYIVRNEIQLGSKDEYPRLTEEQRMACRRLAVAYDRIGFFIQNHLIPENPFLKWHGLEIKRLWKKMKYAVDYIRDHEQRDDYCRALQDLANKCEELPESS